MASWEYLSVALGWGNAHILASLSGLRLVRFFQIDYDPNSMLLTLQIEQGKARLKIEGGFSDNLYVGGMGRGGSDILKMMGANIR